MSLSFLFGNSRSGQAQGRRLVDGRLVRDDDMVRPSRTIRWFRALFTFLVLLVLSLTNPANQAQLEAVLKRPNDSTKTFAASSSNTEDDFQWMIEKAQQAYSTYQWFTQSYKNPQQQHADAPFLRPDDRLVNFGLFSVRETTTKPTYASTSQPQHVLQVFAGGHTPQWQCRIAHSAVCRLVQDALLPASPLKKHKARTPAGNKPLEQVEQWLLSSVSTPLVERKYFLAYRLLLGLVLGGLLWSWVAAVEADDTSWPSNKSAIAYLRDALLRGLSPNPHVLVSSTLITLLDLRLYVVPALSVMEDLMDQQAANSWFRVFPLQQRQQGNSDAGNALNYSLAVAALFMAAGAANWSRIAGTLGGRGRGPPQLGYSSDVWAAAALGYLRGVHDPDYGLPLLSSAVTLSLSAASWTRLSLQVAVQHRWTYALSILVLWITADTLGCFLGNYQATHTVLASITTSVADGMQRFMDSWFGGGFIGGASRGQRYY